MNSRWKKVWADFWRNKSRAILTILTIEVGVFTVGFSSNLRFYMNESMDSDFLSSSPSEAMVYASPMNEDSVKIAREVAGVDAVEGRSTTGAKVIRPGEDDVSIQFTAIENPYDLTVNTLKPVLNEDSIPALGEKEALLDSSAASLGYEPGDLIMVELNDGKLRELRLAGYLHSATSIPLNQGFTVTAYVRPDTIVWLGGARNFNALAVSVAENPTDAEHVTAVAQAVADRIERSGAKVSSVYVSQPGHHYAYSLSQGVFFILDVLGWLTVLLSGILIVNTITALMSQQTRQIGIMKAIGGRTHQIFGMNVVLILVFGLCSLLISVPLANKAAQTVSDVMAGWLNFFPATYRGYSAALIQQAVVALIIPLLAAVLPIYNNVRMTVRETLSEYGIGGKTKPKKTSVSKGTLLIPRPMRLSLRNAFRRKARLVLTLFTLILAGALFIGVFNLWASFAQVIDDVKGYMMADINVSFNRAYRLDKVSEMALKVPGVSSVEGWLEFPGILIPEGTDEAGRDILFVAPPSTSTLIDPIVTAGRWLQPGDENAVVIGNHLLNMFPDLKVGDTLTIKVNEKETQWHVIGFYSLPAPSDTPWLYTNYEYISRLLGQPGMVYALRVITDRHDAITQDYLKAQLLGTYEAHGVQVSDTQTGADFIQNSTEFTNVFVYFILGMAVLIAVVGGLGLMGTMSINVLERTREIGVMRAIGASSWAIQSIVISEGVVIGFVSWIISLVLAIPLTNVLTFGVGMAIFSVNLPAVYSLNGMIVWLFGTLLLASIASALPAARASRLTVRDTLAYE
jgi:putative ABC transport system permease protein